MIHPDMGEDMLSLSMFWAGLLMVFTPLLCAGAVLAVWWRQRSREARHKLESGSVDEPK
jgi:hypothetical protein